MPRGKKNTPVAEPVVETVVEAAKTEEVSAPVEAPAEKKAAAKPAAKKAAAKKPAAKKTTKKEAAKAPAKASKATVFIQYAGIQATADELVEKAKEVSGVKSPKSINVYVKPEENKVYYVVDDNAGDFELA